jgi:hypothetical protein
MKCEKYAHLIDDLVEGELDEQTNEQVSLHVFTCPNCTSRFEMLEREKEMYAHYLFEIEPPVDLLAKFQTKLETVEQPTILAANSTFAPFGWITKLLNLLRLNPVLATAAVLILFVVSFGLINLVKEELAFERIAEYQGLQLILPKIEKTSPKPSPEPERDQEVVKNEKSKLENKPLALKQTGVVKKAQPKSKTSPENGKLNEDEKAQIKMIQALEIETAKQIEKVELLLRSFRNARVVEGKEIYDISYEKQQAGKLLQNNVELRQRAEIYGNLFTEEMLSKVEPYLLDIANLDVNPSTEEILVIKERVRNQNIIASLQGF